MDSSYWRTRCEAAERALQRARSGLTMTSQRKAAMQTLGELRPGQTLDTSALAQALHVQVPQAHKLLSTMEDLGLVDRVPGKPGLHGSQAGWKLAHLVQVEAVE